LFASLYLQPKSIDIPPSFHILNIDQFGCLTLAVPSDGPNAIDPASRGLLYYIAWKLAQAEVENSPSARLPNLPLHEYHSSQQPNQYLDNDRTVTIPREASK
jgi:hypothetical protein